MLKKYKVSFSRLIVLLLILVITTLISCSNRQTHPKDKYHAFIDTAVTVYGPYVAIRLPIKQGVPLANPIQLAMGPNQVLYAANSTGEVYTLRDHDGDGLEETAEFFCNVKDDGLRLPGGFAHKGDTVFIGTSQQIRAYLDINQDGKADTSWAFVDNLPQSEHPYEWTSGLTFGPDGWLYCALTTDSWNAAPSPDPNGYRGAILRISPDGKVIEKAAVGIRSVYSMQFNAEGDLFFIDNEGGGNPTEELNRLVPNGFYGHNKKKYAIDSIIKPEYDLQTEIAPSAIVFNKTGNDFGGLGGNLLVAYYGPGERWTRGAVASVEINRQPDGKYTYREKPLADIAKLSGIAFGNDGSLYLAQHGKADYWYNAIYPKEGHFYKLIYDPGVTSYSDGAQRNKPDRSFSKNSLELGKQLFAERACLGCHQVDGVTELLGPNLKNLGKQFSREEILESITKPSAQIKPSMMAVRITRKDGQVMIGRVITSDEQTLSLMLVGNHTVTVDRDDIEKMEDVPKSLMYEGLLNGMTEEQTNALLDYLIGLSQ